MKNKYIIEILNNVTSPSYWLGDGVELQYRANRSSVQVHDGGKWVLATFTSEDAARRVALEINSRMPAKIMRFNIKAV